jgi:hypothetical protein
MTRILSVLLFLEGVFWPSDGEDEDLGSEHRARCVRPEGSRSRTRGIGARRSISHPPELSDGS